MNAIKIAFPDTLPVLMGYLSIGMAFGFMLDAAGYSILWAGVMSLTIYAGSGQYLGVGLMASGASFGHVALMILILHLRHMVYGLSLLEKFRGMGWRKGYMIFSLTDETYALLSSARVPTHVSAHDYYFAVALLNHSYWIGGSLLGSLLASLVTIDTMGIEFAMTALFLVIAVEQWKSYASHVPALLGSGIACASLFCFGADGMLIPTLLVLLAALFALRNRLDEPMKEGCDP